MFWGDGGRWAPFHGAKGPPLHQIMRPPMERPTFYRGRVVLSLLPQNRCKVASKDFSSAREATGIGAASASWRGGRNAPWGADNPSGRTQLFMVRQRFVPTGLSI